ncbi:hypothetical protein EV182_005365, partial [Spiromyces aspiralis]
MAGATGTGYHNALLSICDDIKDDDSNSNNNNNNNMNGSVTGKDSLPSSASLTREPRLLSPEIDCDMLESEDGSSPTSRHFLSGKLSGPPCEFGLPSLPESPTGVHPSRVRAAELAENRSIIEVARALNRRTLSWDEIPLWMRDNIFIRTGYRIPTASYFGCIHSLTYLHNESGNVWSHLLGSLTFVFLLFATYLYVFPDIKTLAWSDVTVTCIFLVGAVTCMMFSACFHLFSCHSEDVQLAWNRCDYLGIVLLIVGSCIPTIYYAFHCNNLVRLFHISVITLLGVGTAIMTVNPAFSASEWRVTRAATFFGLGFSGIIPLFHSLVSFG